jgi:hypothetical protein
MQFPPSFMTQRSLKLLKPYEALFPASLLGVALTLLLGGGWVVVPVAVADESHNHDPSPTMADDDSHPDQDTHSPMQHGHDLWDIPAGQPIPTIQIVIHEDSISGWNLEIQTTNFQFSPETVNQDPMLNRGHGHLYINGEKISRVYGPWMHLPSLPSGRNEITVELNADNHQPFAHNGEKIESTVVVEVP